MSRDDDVSRNPDLTGAYRLSAAVGVLLLIDAIGGLLASGLYKDTAVWAAQARGVNLVDLLVGLPTLVASLLLSTRGSLRARVVWVGVLGYMLYDAVIFAFEIAFNPLFLIYVAVLSLSAFSLIALLTHLDVLNLRARFAPRTPIRSISVYLVIVALLFFLAWLKDIIPATFGSTTPTNITQAKLPTNPVYVLDLGFLIPLYVLSAFWLLRRRGWGYLLAGALLVLNTLLSLSIVSSTIFQYAADRSTSLSVVPMFGTIAAVSAVLAVRYLQNLREGF
jgi:hypothetical protein